MSYLQFSFLVRSGFPSGRVRTHTVLTYIHLDDWHVPFKLANNYVHVHVYLEMAILSKYKH